MSVPDAWDDDWEAVADKPTSRPLSKEQRKAQHVETNKQLWDAAEQPDRFHFLETKTDIPLKDEIKQVKVLSRRPAVEKEESEEEGQPLNLAERQKRAQEERLEKQRKYAEARERLFGPESKSKPSSTEQSPVRPAKQLFDPSASQKPKTRSPRPSTPKGEQPVRMPRGPDGSGKGFGRGRPA